MEERTGGMKKGNEEVRNEGRIGEELGMNEEGRDEELRNEKGRDEKARDEGRNDLLSVREGEPEAAGGTVEHDPGGVQQEQRGE